MREYRLGVIGGDGIGPEVTAAALRVLDAAEARFGFTTFRQEYPWSGARYLATGEHVTPALLEPLRALDAILFGAVGHPGVPRGLLEREIIFGLRQGFDLFVNLRPLVLYDERLCPLKGKGPRDVDIVVIRENTEDVYGREGTTLGEGPDQTASVEMRFTRRGIERIIRYAFARARERPRRHLTLVDKANAIPIQGLWREVLEELGGQFPDVTTDAMYVDAACMWLVQKPERFDVVVTTNLFGDIISDLGAAICGGLGVGASGNIHPGRVSMFEPIHGSAPKYAGQGVASPIGAIGALALLLTHIGEREAAAAVDGAVRRGFADGWIRGVEAGSAPTMAVADGVADAL
ncbi:MAG: isocitrate/isopropylmalate dehydrogenase family protein [Candidatus Limnocylindria bacterium]